MLMYKKLSPGKEVLLKYKRQKKCMADIAKIHGVAGHTVKSWHEDDGVTPYKKTKSDEEKLEDLKKADPNAFPRSSFVSPEIREIALGAWN